MSTCNSGGLGLKKIAMPIFVSFNFGIARNKRTANINQKIDRQAIIKLRATTSRSGAYFLTDG
jgi:hypothetical protein